ncbi:MULTISPECIES: ABC transporter permease [unclassified Cyanobium]|uniref:ABC transporter permease n=1 Tax=unclassified Cyanobium TaxID=2627006 RepID=UPI0020CC5E7A|nr:MULTISPECIES: ABC transporter permease [unclassified Cyanobium]MCP9860554.1 ABC transporter permease [Cyanobium sp. Cruz-8H5]MCP9867637.1 ABC transporter permease [Cyanobium sp. Cruz-8D1]
MINLAWPDSRHNWGKLLITGCGLGLLVGVTVSMAGVYRGMVEDAEVLIGGSGADLWVVEQHTLGPFAEASRIDDDLHRSIRQLPGVRRAINGSFQTLLIQRPGRSLRVLVAGVEVGVPGGLGQPPGLVAGRSLLRDRDELLADPGTGLQLGEVVPIRRKRFTVVGLTTRMVSPTGDPMLFVPFRDGQDLQFLPGNEAIARQRRRRDRPVERQALTNAVLVQLEPTARPELVAAEIERWLGLTAYTRPAMQAAMVGKLIEASARQIGLFLVILTLVTTTMIGFIVFTLTQGKLREIAVLKLIGMPSRLIAWMIVQQAVALGLFAFVLGTSLATVMAPRFPRHVVLQRRDLIAAAVVALASSSLASLVGVKAALGVDPAEAIQ